MVFDHIGIAVKNIEDYYERVLKPLGFNSISKCFVHEEQQVKVAFVSTDKGINIELVEPLDADSPVTGILERGMGGLYHLGFLTNQLEADIAELKSKKFKVISKKSNAAHMISPSFEVVELEVYQKNNKDKTVD